MIFTFYSYKGGVGRSMALANVAELFYRSGKKVLMVDWDLEAPGLERFFSRQVNIDTILDRQGVIDMLLNYKHHLSKSWGEFELSKGSLPFENIDPFVTTIYPMTSNGGELKIITSGQRAGTNFSKYANTVLNFDWIDFYQRWEGERYFEWLRQKFDRISDITLIDSRTGVTEMGGVCTYHLADVVVILCAPNEQNLHGTERMVRNFQSQLISQARSNRPLTILIVPARLERAESQLLDRFKVDFFTLLGNLGIGNGGISVSDLWNMAIPYIPKYAYSETIAVRESSLASAEDIVNAYERLQESMENLLDPVRMISEPTGTLRANSKYYIERDSDTILRRELRKTQGVTITITGPRQVGKSSLMSRAIMLARQDGKKTIYLDLQQIDPHHVENLDTFMRYIASMIATKLNLDSAIVDRVWQSKSFDSPGKLTYWMEESVLSKVTERIILALDEVDKLLQTPVQSAFFSLLRSWHNLRAIEPLWDKLDIVMVISTEPHLLIADVAQSPFNVGTRILIHDFNKTQVQTLYDRYSLIMEQNEIDDMMDYLNGHPYLTHMAIYSLASLRHSWLHLRHISATDQSPFNDHLRRYLWLLRDQPILVVALKQMMRHAECPDEASFYRLLQAGLIQGSSHTSCAFRCKLYEEFLRNKI